MWTSQLINFKFVFLKQFCIKAELFLIFRIYLSRIFSYEEEFHTIFYAISQVLVAFSFCKRRNHPSLMFQSQQRPHFKLVFRRLQVFHLIVCWTCHQLKEYFALVDLDFIKLAHQDPFFEPFHLVHDSKSFKFMYFVKAILILSSLLFILVPISLPLVILT